MRIDRRDPDETGRDYRGWVNGFLTDVVRVYASVAAAAAAERDALLSAVLSLAPDRGGADGPPVAPSGA